MSDSVHTPAPWTLYAKGHSTPGCGEYPHISGPDGTLILDGGWYASFGGNDQDLSLIAAAPELLSALETIIDLCKNGRHQSDCPEFGQALVAAELAVAKAKMAD
ncbi:hypothetical protein [Pseudomonas sp. ESBL1]|uniref:hypothetical protein n=1 Tax=Pseudomonas sp. ESBL1 TaxID=3077324 RepID=UPI002FC8B826